MFLDIIRELKFEVVFSIIYGIILGMDWNFFDEYKYEGL